MIEEILSSKKYAYLHRGLVERVCEEVSFKYGSDKERLKAVKNILHSMFGAYFPAGNYKKAVKLLDSPDELLQLHASTKERFSTLGEFYDFIFGVTGKVDSVLDIGCGLNPFTLGYFPQVPKEYHALDIDSRIAELNNSYFRRLGLPELAGCWDIVSGSPKITVDVAFLFKLLPLIPPERRAAVLDEIDARFIVVTYPTKSLGGREKGMKSFYSVAFEEIAGSRIIARKGIGNELVFVVKNS